MNKATASTLVRVPARYWSDYCDRWPLGSQEDAVVIEASRKGRVMILWLSGPVYDDLLNDARHYADKYGPDAIEPGLRASARAMVRALTQQDRGGEK